MNKLSERIEKAEKAFTSESAAKRDAVSLLSLAVAVFDMQRPLLHQEPFEGALKRVRAHAGERPLVVAVLDQFPERAVREGVPTLSELQHSLDSIALDVAKRATPTTHSGGKHNKGANDGGDSSLLDIVGATLRYVAGTALAVSPARRGFVRGNEPSAVLSRAAWQLQRDALRASMDEVQQLLDERPDLGDVLSPWLSSAQRRHRVEHLVSALIAEIGEDAIAASQK